jgi:cyclohexanone monooxygenase
VPGAYRLQRASQWAFCDFLLRVYGSERVARTLNVLGRLHIRAVIRDRRLRRALVPDYTLGCKRIMLSNNFYPALNRSNVDLVPHPVREVRRNSVVAADGSEHEADVLIWATGFHVSDLPFTDRIRGRSGETLAQVWGDNPSAYLGTAISGFPNAFMLFGPNVGTASAFAMLEGQLNHLIAAVSALRANGLAQMEIRPEVQRAYKQECNRRLARSTWNAGGCTSYYMDAKGENYSVFPGTMRELVRRGAAFSLDDHVTVPERNGQPVERAASTAAPRGESR